MSRICALCGKELKGPFKHERFGQEFCADCYGCVTLFCHAPENVGKFRIDQLKAIHRKDACDLCGQHVSPIRKKFICDGMICRDCEKLLRPYFDNSDDKKASLLLNGIETVVNVATGTSGTMNTYETDDPMEMAGIEELREKYGEITT